MGSTRSDHRYRGRMIARLAVTTLALAMVAALATGCQPEPQPAPSNRIFATEEEAFAAAEETYRAYVDALNQRRADPSSMPDPQTFLTGHALEVDIDTQQQLAQSGLALGGSTLVTRVNHISVDLTTGSVRLDVCLDSSDTQVLGADGQDLTPLERQPVSLLQVDLVAIESVLIADSTTKVVGGC